MAGNNDRNGVAPVSRAHRARRAGLADASGQGTIVCGRTIRNFLQRAPHAALKRCAGGIDRQIEVFAIAGEVLIKLLARANDELSVRLPLPLGSNGGILFFTDKM